MVREMEERMFRVRLLTILLCLGICVALFLVMALWFYVLPLTHCTFCSYINCLPLPFIPNFCDNMQIHVDTGSPSCYLYQY